MRLFIDPGTLVGFCLVLVRAGAWVAICPPFNTPAVPPRVRAGIAVSIAMLLGHQVGTEVESLATLNLVGMLFTQALAGFTLGLFVFVIFSAIQSAGEMIDLQVGFSMGAVIDPMSGSQSTPVGRLHQLLAVAILFAINGHVLIVRAFIRSVEMAPMGHIDGAKVTETLAKLVATLLAASIEIALPVLTALFCTEVALGFLGKAAPQLNIMVIGFAIKSLLTFALLGTTMMMLPETVDSLIGKGLRAALGVFTG